MKNYSFKTTASHGIALGMLAIGLTLASLETARAQLPANFPPVTVTTNYAPGVDNGCLFLTDSYKASNY